MIKKKKSLKRIANITFTTGAFSSQLGTRLCFRWPGLPFPPVVSTVAPTHGFIVTAGPFQNWEGLTAHQATSSGGRKPWAGPSYVRLQAWSQCARPAHLCKGSPTTDRGAEWSSEGIVKPPWGTVPWTHSAQRLHRTGHLLFFLMLQGAYNEVLLMVGLKTFHFKLWSHLQTCKHVLGWWDPSQQCTWAHLDPKGLLCGWGAGGYHTAKPSLN